MRALRLAFPDLSVLGALVAAPFPAGTAMAAVDAQRVLQVASRTAVVSCTELAKVALPNAVITLAKPVGTGCPRGQRVEREAGGVYVRGSPGQPKPGWRPAQ